MGENTVFTGKLWEQSVPHAPGNITTGKLLHISGITARKPDGSVNGPGDMRKQAEQIVQNIKDVCAASGANIGGIVRMTIYTTDIDTFQEVRDAIEELYVSRPAATLVEVSKLASPDMILEIEPTVEMNN